MSSRDAKATGASKCGRSWADVVKTTPVRQPPSGAVASAPAGVWLVLGRARAGACAGACAGTGAWPKLGAGRWADLAEESEWDLDSQLLHAMEAREDLERGADDANWDTFGDGGSWSFEEQLAANQRLLSPPVPVPR